MSREGYHLLSVLGRTERDKKIIEFYDQGVLVKIIAKGMRLSYEGVRSILRKAGRMGKTDESFRQGNA